MPGRPARPGPHLRSPAHLGGPYGDAIPWLPRNYARVHTHTRTLMCMQSQGGGPGLWVSLQPPPGDPGLLPSGREGSGVRRKSKACPGSPGQIEALLPPLCGDPFANRTRSRGSGPPSAGGRGEWLLWGGTQWTPEKNTRLQNAGCVAGADWILWSRIPSHFLALGYPLLGRKLAGPQTPTIKLQGLLPRPETRSTYFLSNCYHTFPT